MLVGTDPESGVFIPNIESQAKTYCLPYIYCKNNIEMNDAIKKALAMDGPVLVEINALQSQRMIPSVMSEKLADGRMQSKSLHEMYPYLPQADLDKELNEALNIN
jgi:acetolactate synthase-1/2/3 large subunit